MNQRLCIRVWMCMSYVCSTLFRVARICIILCLYIFIRRVYAMPSYFVHIRSHSCHGRISSERTQGETSRNFELFVSMPQRERKSHSHMKLVSIAFFAKNGNSSWTQISSKCFERAAEKNETFAMCAMHPLELNYVNVIWNIRRHCQSHTKHAWIHTHMKLCGAF